MIHDYAHIIRAIGNNVIVNVFSEMAGNDGIYFGMISFIIHRRLADGSMFCNL